jgi:hypothetical protein
MRVIYIYMYILQEERYVDAALAVVRMGHGEPDKRMTPKQIQHITRSMGPWRVMVECVCVCVCARDIYTYTHTHTHTHTFNTSRVPWDRGALW